MHRISRLARLQQSARQSKNGTRSRGRVVDAKVEEDGDLHIALNDATGDKKGTLVCDVPLKPQWCDIRETVFSWTPTRFPFQTSSAKRLKIAKSSGRHHCWESVLGYWPRTERSRQPSQIHAGLRCVGNSSGDETHSPMNRV
jgi:hypothetical protein